MFFLLYFLNHFEGVRNNRSIHNIVTFNQFKWSLKSIEFLMKNQYSIYKCQNIPLVQIFLLESHSLFLVALNILI